MTKQKRPDPLIEALKQGLPYTLTMVDGGNFASMREAVKHGETLTFSPLTDPTTLKVGAIVLVNWRGGTTIMHLVGDIRADQFLIINSLGKENGWVTAAAILGYVTERIEPAPCPVVPVMIDQLERAYAAVIQRYTPPAEDAARLRALAADLRWYAAVIVPSQWDQLPRLNRWSFAQHLWHLLQEAEHATQAEIPAAVRTLIHHGKAHVGQVADGAMRLAADNQAFPITQGNNRTAITIRNVNTQRDLVPLVNLRNLCAGSNATPITLEEQRTKFSEPNQQPATDHWVAHTIDEPWTLLGQSFGYHTIPERYLAWLEVHPAWRRRGLGGELLRRVIARAKAVGADHILINVDQDEQNGAAHAFLQHHGFGAKSDAWMLRASADVGVTPPQWPAGYHIRSFAEVQDLAVLWQACYQSYGDQWGHGENSAINRAKPPQTTVSAWLNGHTPPGENLFLLFDEQGKVAGICRGFVGEENHNGLPTGVIDAPGVVPPYRHLGLQRPLTQMVMQWLRAQGQGALELHSFGDSAATVALYRDLGFTLAQHFIAYHLDISPPGHDMVK
ncbi:MAG: GNAT family N-acetyltransferase [Caldilineaceae bacterium]